ncbi:MAG: PrgI family protein [Oscillospiraceae bacterium]
MITVRIPKEIKEYKEKVALGLTGRQLICSILAIAIAVPLYIFGSKIINQEIISWLIIFLVLPLGAIGFVNKNGMPFEKFIVAVFKTVFLYPTKRIYKTNSFFKNCQNTYNTQEKAKQSKNYNKLQKEISFERCFFIEELNKKENIK